MKIVSANIAVGILSTGADIIEAYRELGAVFIAVGVDTVALAGSANAIAGQYID